MWRHLARIRTLSRARPYPAANDAHGLDSDALRELRESYVSGLLPVQDFEWGVRQLARQARGRLPFAGPPVIPRRERSPLARTSRALISPLALFTVLAALAGTYVLAGRTGAPEMTLSAGDGESLAPMTTPFPRVMPGMDGVIAADYFDRPETGLLPKTSSDPAKYGRGYMDGGYALRVIDPTWHFVAQARPVGMYDDAGVAVDTTLLGDVADRYVAVSCRDNGNTEMSGYRLSVEPARGVYALSRWDGGRQVALSPLQPSPVIRRSHGVNRIGLSCFGSEITASINGAAVKTVSDGTYVRGRVWFGVSAYAGQNLTADARFHNLVISDR